MAEELSAKEKLEIKELIEAFSTLKILYDQHILNEKNENEK